MSAADRADSLAATRAVMRQQHGAPTDPTAIAAVLRDIAETWARMGVLSVSTSPDRFHALTGAAEMLHAFAENIDAELAEQAEAEARAYFGRYLRCVACGDMETSCEPDAAGEPVCAYCRPTWEG